MAETVNVTDQKITTTPGSAGVDSQLTGQPATVSNLGDVAPGNLAETDIDDELFKFQSDDTPLMQLMLKARKVNVTSPIVEHYMIDEERCRITTTSKLAASTGQTAILPLSAEDQAIPQEYDTIICLNVDGYNAKGEKTPGKWLMLYVVGMETNGSVVVRAVNGPKTNESDVYSKVPEIPANTTLVICGNALYETQKDVSPDMIVPQPSLIYLQKRGLNQVVSDYFDAQKKRIPFTHSVIAEAAIAKFKRKGNRTLWISRNGMFKVKTDKVGTQNVYTTEGVRWQFKKELQHKGDWAYEQFIGLAKMYFTGEDVPKTGLALCGKNFLERIQCIDYTKHPEVQISVKTNPLGWEVTNIHTVFGDIELKREPTLDRLGYSNSAAIIGENRLVHYVYKNESQFEDKIDGEEAKRNGILVWDGLALKGSCHIFVDGEGETANADAQTYCMWDSAEAPDVPPGTKSHIYYLLQDCPAIGAGAKQGEMWQHDGTSWVEYTGLVKA